MRRGTFRDETVDYAAVGATQASDLMHFPPERSIPAEEAWRIGSGEDRFHSASEALLSWGPHKGGGLTLSDVRPAAGPMYSGVSFDAEGNAIAPSRADADLRYDADGTPYVAAGTTIRTSPAGAWPAAALTMPSAASTMREASWTKVVRS